MGDELIGIVAIVEEEFETLAGWLQQHELRVSVVEMDRQAVVGIHVVMVALGGYRGIREGEHGRETGAQRLGGHGLPRRSGELCFEIIDRRWCAVMLIRQLTK